MIAKKIISARRQATLVAGDIDHHPGQRRILEVFWSKPALNKRALS